MNIKLPSLNKEDYVIVATSGGPDSMALLHMIKDCPFNIVVANVNYKTRKESDYEQIEVGNYCKKYNLIYESCVAQGFEKGNFEAWARDYRYNFFKELYDKYSAKYLFVAHNLDDFIETYYIQKKRNIITRYYGIKYITHIFGMDVCRPVLEYYKSDLEDYCKNNNVFYSIDSTNLKDDYLRNQIRHNVVSLMSREDKIKEYNNILKLNEELKVKFDIVDEEYEKYVKDDVLLASFIDSDNSTLILFKYLNMKHMSSPRMKDIINKFKSKQNIIIELDDNVSLVKEYENIRKIVNENVSYSYTINDVEYLDTKYFKITSSGDGKHCLLVSREDFPLTIRNAYDNDVIIMKHGSKKVSRVFIDSKIGIYSRKKWPVVVNKEGIILLVSGLTKNYNYSNSKESYDYKIYVYEK